MANNCSVDLAHITENINIINNKKIKILQRKLTQRKLGNIIQIVTGFEVTGEN